MAPTSDKKVYGKPMHLVKKNKLNGLKVIKNGTKRVKGKRSSQKESPKVAY